MTLPVHGLGQRQGRMNKFHHDDPVVHQFHHGEGLRHQGSDLDLIYCQNIEDQIIGLPKALNDGSSFLSVLLP
jgi:hypothetical protein